MNAVRVTLVDLFARLTRAEIESDEKHLIQAFGVNSFAAVKALPMYDEEYHLVRRAKGELERIAKYEIGNGDQALQCLCLLSNLRSRSAYLTDDYIVTRDLIGKSLYKGWPPSDQARFDERRKVLEDWSDFFLSYTNRDATDINNRYRKLINAKIGWPGVTRISERNYVARVLAKFFEAESLHAFVDFKSLQCGDELDEKIRQRCRTSFAFVQVVERMTLSEPPPGKVNWCHVEYREFVNSTFPAPVAAPEVNRRFFVLAGATELKKPANMGLAYEDWYDDMSKRLRLVIDIHDAKPWDQLRDEVGRVAEQIVTARKQLINSMLATWQ